MSLPNYYTTITEEFEFKYKEKGSIFIGCIFPVNNMEEALNKLKFIKKKFFDATHHTFAINTLYDGFKYSDDGEPTGTAGIKIYNIIEKFQLNNIMIIVIRYYGGVKLGVGPLGKAYQLTAEETVKNSKTIIMFKRILVEIYFDYTFSGSIHHFIKNNKILIKQNLFNDKPGLQVLIEPTLTNELMNYLKELTSDNYFFKVISDDIFIKEEELPK